MRQLEYSDMKLFEAKITKFTKIIITTIVFHSYLSGLLGISSDWNKTQPCLISLRTTTQKFNDENWMELASKLYLSL